MNRDEFAQAVFDRLPKECPAHDGKRLRDILFGEAVSEVVYELKPEEVDETEAAVCRSSKE